ncbi:MAG TPA: SDR family oxidoreductase [Propionibacteriaceae bacterium]|jgi:NAD(P)H dehydrogenase (quinone)|nr:SDR family oxidoreductase [Propionibacteriaceae bacterium]
MIAAQTALAVTGSTGRLGSRVARALSRLGVDQRLVVRDPSKAPALPGSHIVTADYSDGAGVRTALTGAHTVFMVSASETPDRVQQHITFIDAAVAAGVQRIVYVSFFGASPTAIFTLGRDHWATEEHLRSVGVAHTILRDNIYADFTPHFIGTDGSIRGPAGDGRVAVVAQADIAEVAVAVLTSDGAYDGRTLNLTGPEALTMNEIAAILSDHLGRTVSYIPETIDEAYASRASYGAPQWQVDGWVSTYTAIAAGELATVSEDIPEVTGHPAMTLTQVLEAG